MIETAMFNFGMIGFVTSGLYAIVRWMLFYAINATPDGDIYRYIHATVDLSCVCSISPEHTASHKLSITFTVDDITLKRG